MTFLEILIAKLAPHLIELVVVPFVIWLIVAAKKWFTAKTASSTSAAIVSRVLHFAEVVVADIEATLRPSVQKALADGKLSKEEGEQLKTEALDRLKTLLGQHGLSELQAVLGLAAPQLAIYLSALIERVVANFHAKPTVTVVPLPVTMTPAPDTAPTANPT